MCARDWASNWPTACSARAKPARVRWHGGLPHGPAATRPGLLGHGTVRAHRLWSLRGGHAHGSGLAWLAASNRVMRCGETGGDNSCRKRGRCWARRDRRGQLSTVMFRWMVALAIFGDLRGGIVAGDGGEGGWWWCGRSRRGTGVRGKIGWRYW
jgi:hypothetical protein